MAPPSARWRPRWACWWRRCWGRASSCAATSGTGWPSARPGPSPRSSRADSPRCGPRASTIRCWPPSRWPPSRSWPTCSASRCSMPRVACPRASTATRPCRRPIRRRSRACCGAGRTRNSSCPRTAPVPSCASTFPCRTGRPRRWPGSSAWRSTAPACSTNTPGSTAGFGGRDWSPWWSRAPPLPWPWAWPSGGWHGPTGCCSSVANAWRGPTAS